MRVQRAMRVVTALALGCVGAGGCSPATLSDGTYESLKSYLYQDSCEWLNSDASEVGAANLLVQTTAEQQTLTIESNGVLGPLMPTFDCTTLRSREISCTPHDVVDEYPEATLKKSHALSGTLEDTYISTRYLRMDDCEGCIEGYVPCTIEVGWSFRLE